MTRRTTSATPAAPPLRLTAHPPERGRGGRPVTLPCACCCCCCCCLHSVGSLIGGIVGSLRPLNLPPRESFDPDFPFPFRRDELDEEGPVLPAGVLYWLLLGLLLGAGAVWGYLESRTGRPDDLLTGLVLGLMLLPLPQLGASVLTFIAAWLFYADRRAALARVGMITLYSFLGTLIGLALLGVFCGIFAVWK